MSRTVRLLLAGLVTVLAVLVGTVVVGGGGEEPASTPEPTSTPLASFDTSAVTVLRSPFCDRVPSEAVEEALGAAPDKATSYGNGDVVRLSEGVRDRVHEVGCRWAAEGTSARAWVFVPPTTPAGARALTRTTRRTDGCRPLPEAPAYGAPSVALACEEGAGTEVSFRGLFGDAWLTCTLTLDQPRADAGAVERTGRWCVAVAQAAGESTVGAAGG